MVLSATAIQPGSAFLKVYAFTSRWEGAFVDHPADSGGPTNHGISLKFLQEHDYDVNGEGVVDVLDVLTINDTHAQSLYHLLFWQPLCCEALPLPLAMALFDGAVNMGPLRAVRQMQAAMNACAKDLGQKLAQDGRVGPKTLALADALDSLHRSAEAAQGAVHLRLEYYRNLCERKPQLRVFLKGWERRCAALLGELLLLGAKKEGA